MYIPIDSTNTKYEQMKKMFRRYNETFSQNEILTTTKENVSEAETLFHDSCRNKFKVRPRVRLVIGQCAE